MKRRLFIAINLDPRTLAAIDKIARGIEDSFGREYGDTIRFVPKENWHITVSFLGTQDDADLSLILTAMRETAEHFSAFDISLAEIAYAPNKDNPRMIWLKTAHATSAILEKLRRSLEDHLADRGIRFEHEARAFSGHITLARFANGASKADLPSIERHFAIECAGSSLDLMESEMDSRGATYSVLQKFPFS